VNKRRVSDLHNDDPNDLLGQCVYMPEDVEPQLSRLRERVGELEISLAVERVVSLEAVQAKSAAEDRADDLESDLRHYGESEGARCASKIRKLESRERLLLEAVRWLLDNAVGSCGDNLYQHFGHSEPTEAPAHLAPLIAEAMQQQENGNG
jgi:hypothetical protein